MQIATATSPGRPAQARHFAQALVTGLLALALALGAAPARAAITVYTDLASFLAAIAPGAYTETFSGLPNTPSVVSSPAAFSGGGYGFEVSAPNGLISTNIGGDKGLGLFTPATLTLGGLSGPGPVNAIGGFFFMVQGGGEALNASGALSVTATTGAASARQAVAAPTSLTSFVGFVSDADPFTSLAAVRTSGLGTGFVAVDDVILGARATPTPTPIPVPASAALLGAGLLGLAALARRRREHRPAT
jgi:hypothetical protein